MSPLRPSTVPVAKSLVSRIDKAMRWRADEQVSPHVADLHHRLAALERRLDEFGQRLDKIGHENFWTAEDMRRIAPQVAALDSRLEDMRQHSQPVAGTPEEVVEARNVLDEVRREHERIRVRLGAVAWYEDRLRKLEDQLSSQTSGSDDVRPGDEPDPASQTGGNGEAASREAAEDEAPQR
ncbi:MAG: hypothetical protein H0V49_01450 [Nocardioidaceae bacterium]|nr:hypothetical protein [Nocardioidaceae bacterium]